MNNVVTLLSSNFFLLFWRFNLKHIKVLWKVLVYFQNDKLIVKNSHVTVVVNLQISWIRYSLSTVWVIWFTGYVWKWISVVNITRNIRVWYEKFFEVFKCCLQVGYFLNKLTIHGKLIFYIFMLLASYLKFLCFVFIFS